MTKDPSETSTPGERLQKILARAGISSRRMAEDLIREGAVTVNGKVAQIGDKAVFGKDAIKVQGKLLQGAEEKVYYAFHKPKAVISMMVDPEGRPTISDYIARLKMRLFPIGRLDFMSDGLILLTNDGEVAEKLQRQDSVVRVYEVKIKGHPDANTVERLRRGAKIGNRFVKPHSVRVDEELTSKSLIEFALVGSGVFDVKTYFEQKGCLVDRITRVAIGQIRLGDLKAGDSRALTGSQINSLLAQPELGIRSLERNEEREAEREGRRLERLARREEAEAAATEHHYTSTPAADERPRGASRGYQRRPTSGAHSGDFRREREAYKAAREAEDGATRAPRGDRPAKSWGGEERPARKPFGDRPPRTGGFGDERPRKAWGRDRSAEERPRKAWGRDEDRPRKPWNRDGGERKPFGDRPARKPFGDRPQKSWGDRPRGSGFGEDRPRKSFGDRDRAPRTGGFGSDRPRKPFGDRPPRTGGLGEDRPRSKSFGGGRKPFGDRPPRTGGFGGDRPRGKPFGDRDRGPRSGGFGSDRPKKSWGSDRPRGGSNFGGGERKSGWGAKRDGGGDRPSRPRGIFVKRKADE